MGVSFFALIFETLHIHNNMRIHLIGNEGVSMRWIGDYYRFHGHQVSGSDVSNGGHKAENVDGAELVIYTSAITPDNPELNRAKELGIRVISRATALGEIEGAFGTYSLTI